MPMITKDELFAKIKQSLPKDAKLTDQRFEGANVVLFSANPKFVTGSTDLVKKIAKEVKKRIDVRADSSLVMKLEPAEEKIRELFSEAEISSIEFDSGGSKVLIEAERPAVIVGKAGEGLAKIKEETFWTPEIFRTPPLKSDIVSTIRKILIKRSKERATFLNRVGNRIYTGTKPPAWVRLSSFGGFREVGRSCILLQTPESRVIFDCGINVAGGDDNSFPYLDAPDFDITKLDAVVLSHAHLDHSGLIPLLFKYGFRGPVYCTAPTRALMALLQLDSIDIAQSEGKKPAYSSSDIHEEMLHTITLDYGEVTDITPDVRITFYEAGHIIGSAVTHIHIGDGVYNLVYTGDIKYAKTRLLDSAWNQFPRCEALVIEATYGAAGDIQPPIAAAEDEVARIIKETIERGGKLLIPVLGVGRSQEIMLLIDELVKKGTLPQFPVYLDGMMWDATAIYTTYPEFLSEKIRNQILSKEENPLMSKVFSRVAGKKEREAVLTGPPCVIMATSGMLTGGPSVEYLKNLADSELNAILFINYQGEGSLGKKIQRGMPILPVPSMGGTRKEGIPVKLSVHTVDGFSAHSDRNQLMNFIGDMRSRPGLVVVQHGENSKCADLMRSIHKAFRIETVAPRNLEAIRLR
ncbi:MAG: beta-CASP ribonuclease aCPSF1 [archaeon]